MCDCDRALEVPSIRALGFTTVHASSNARKYPSSLCGERFNPKTARVGTEAVNCRRCSRILEAK